IDPIIELIKASNNRKESEEKLVSQGWELGNVASMLSEAGNDAARPEWLEPEYGIRDGLYYLTAEQAKAIVDLQLYKLSGMEHDKILSEYKALLDLIAELMHILATPARLMEVICEELVAIRDEFGDERRTEITNASHDLSLEDLITEEDVVVTLSHEGYVKYQVLSDYEAQRRGGKGKAATKMKEEDFIERLLVANTHDTILCFSDRGKLYWLKVFQLPLASRTARGRPIVNILPLESDERITAILPVRDYADDKYIVMATASGTVKKTRLDAYSNQRANGIIALNLRDDDTLIGVDITDGNNDIMLFSDAGKVVRFNEKVKDSETGEIKLDPETGEQRWALKPIGRTGTGVRGMKLEGDQKVVSLIVPKNDGPILTITENGFGKRTDLAEYPAKSRATKGVVSIKVSERNGKVVGAVQVEELDEIMLITDSGTLVRTRVNEVSVIGRNTQGVRLIRTAEDEHVVALQRIDEIEEPQQLEEVVEGDEIIETGAEHNPEHSAQQDVADTSQDDNKE
ncbi:MAG TPA: DNA gyrase subunit A, partial [Colwellia sp.]|nr:DNA gyrase subunit A [Colwellia sp.]